MKNKLTILLVAFFIGFSGVGITDLRNNSVKLHIQDIKIQDKITELKKLELDKLDLNNKFDQAINEKQVNEDKVKQLEKEKLDLEQRTVQLEADLQAKANLKAQQKTIATVGITTKVSASPIDAKAFIYQHESGNNPTAVNEIGACGLGQALPCSKMPCSLSDYACQDQWFTDYMLQRYGTWENARSFWIANNWW